MITARQCIKALDADLSRYKERMRPLIERDMSEKKQGTDLQFLL